MMNSNNVVMFPKSYNGPKEVITPEDIDKKIDFMKQFHIQETITTIATMVFNQLDISGFSFADELDDNADTIKDGALIIESLRSIMCKHYGIYHPFQKLSDEIFYHDGEDPNLLKIADNLNIKLKEDVET